MPYSELQKGSGLMHFFVSHPTNGFIFTAFRLNFFWYCFRLTTVCTEGRLYIFNFRVLLR